MSTAEYKKAVYNQIGFVVRKGQREEYQQAAKDFGLTLSELFKTAADVFIAEKSLHDLPFQKPATPTTAAPMTAEEREILDEFNALPDDTRKALLKLVRTINQNQPQK